MARLKNEKIVKKLWDRIIDKDSKEIQWIRNRNIFPYNEYEHICLWPVCSFKKIKEYSLNTLNKQMKEILEYVSE